ncbi:MAG: dipeptidyl-peptidase 3 family protein [Acidobacteriota bacterium]
MRRITAAAAASAAALTLAACAPPEETASATGADGQPTRIEMEIAPDIEERLAQFAPTPLEADLSALADEDRRVLELLVQAAELMDEIFLRQVWVGNPELRERLEGYEGEDAEAAREFYRINFGPWDRLAAFEPFIGGMEHPQGAGYYPVDMSAEELEAWLAEHPEDREAFTSLHTVIRRRGDGLVAVPYSEAYREWLEPAAELLRQAAGATSNASLERFLELRADAFGTDDYFESDMAWMDLDAPVEVTIGPYEVYEDELFGYKAAFEAFVTVDLPEESARLAGYKERLPWLESNLPLPDEHKNPDRGTESPIRVVDEVFTGGDTKAGVQTIAFNLPNDERVREAKGSKKVLLRNVMRAKYDQILVPIAGRVLASEDRDRVSFAAYLDEVLHHELSHGLGPGKITLDGRETEVRLELKDLYSTLEEAKADVMGIYNILALIEEGQMPAELRETLEPTYVAGLFRSARFGVHEAHGQGVVTQFNYLMEKGALEIDEEGRFRTVPERFPGAIRDLLHEMLMLQATGDYQGTAEFLGGYGEPTKPLLDALARLEDVPVDVKPVYAALGG